MLAPGTSSWYVADVFIPTPFFCLTNILASRPFIEGHIRRRVLAVPNVAIVDGTAVQGLVVGLDGQSVAGVRLDGTVVGSDLVVIAACRAGQLPVWLDELGF